MHRQCVELATLCAVLLAIPGCQSPAEKTAEERSEARKEISEAGKDAQKKVDEATKEYGEKLGEAEKTIADEVKEGAKEIGDAEKPVTGPKMGTENRYERFEALKNESNIAFATRADAAIARLQGDLDKARSRLGKGTNKDVSDDLADVDAALKEARKDLEQVRDKTGGVIDDGRLGVATAINKAERNLTDAYDELDKAKM